MTMTQLILKSLTTLLLLIASAPSYSYIGPGIGGGTVAIILGLLSTVVVALFAIVWYPIKKLAKRRKEEDKEHDNERESEEQSEC